MRILGYDITKSKKDSIEAQAGKQRSIMLSDVLKSGKQIKISKDVFYQLYKRNGDIRACVRDIAKRVGVHGIYLEKDGQTMTDSRKKAKEIEKLFRTDTFLNFRVEMFKHLFIGGELFIEPVTNGFGKTVGFNFLDPRSIRKYYDKTTGEITKYEQWAQGASKPVVFTPEELAYYQFEIDPDNNYDGLSIIEGIVYHALTDKEAVEKNYEFFEGGMMIDGIIQLDPDFDKDETIIAKERLENELAGKGRKFLITNTVKGVQQLSVAPKDIDGINQQKMTIEKVCSAFGVPKFIIGYTEGVQRSNGDSSYKQYIEGTIASYQEYAEFVINDLYARFVTKGGKENAFEIKLDGEKVNDRERIEDGQRADLEKGIISIDEARKERGYDPWGKTGFTDVPLIANNLGVLGAEKQAAK